MQNKIQIKTKEHPNVVLKAIPGHFATPNSHVNFFLDMTTLKTSLTEASAVARELSVLIDTGTIIDTIVCIDGCEIIGAFLAEELVKAGAYQERKQDTIHILTPECVGAGQFMFRENYQSMIKGKNVLLLLASATTGQTIVKATQSLSCYGANISGISAVFSAARSMMGIPIKSLFTIADIPGYKAYDPEGCELCREGKAVDAFANAFGYSRIN